MNESKGTPDICELGDQLVTVVRSDPRAAASVLAEMERLASIEGDIRSRAFCLRARGNILQVEGQLSEAIASYRTAMTQFEQGGDAIEAARTASSLVGALAPTGEYDEALKLGEYARAIFESAGLTQRAARLDVNVGNIYHRLGKLDPAYACYQRAARVLAASDDAEAAAGVMTNGSVIAMLLYRFDDALNGFHEATSFCRTKGLTLLETQSEYNRAYLLYLMGRSLEALKILQTVERDFDSHGDRFHVAQCRLDRSDILAELNLHEDALDLAMESAELFESLGASADRARALLLIGRCHVKARKFQRAIRVFSEAKESFEREGNVVWAKLTDLESAAILLDMSRTQDAVQVVSRASTDLRRNGNAIYAVQADLLMVRALMDQEQFDRAAAVLGAIDAGALPVWLRYYARYLSGRLKEATADRSGALAMYRAAAGELEFLAMHIGIDDFLLRFSVDKRDVYSRLIRLTDDSDEAFQCAERVRAFDIQVRTGEQQVEANGLGSERYRDLRQSLRADYVELFQKPASPTVALMDRIGEKERELLRHARQDSIDLLSEGTRVHSIVARPVAANESIVEYFITEDELFVFVVNADQVKARSISISREELERETAFLRHYLGRPGNTVDAGLRLHLEKLYDVLFRPFTLLLRERLIIVPDGCLHNVPFQALIGPDGYLTDSYVVSCAPSAATYVQACESNRRGDSAVLIGLEEAGIPSVERELQSIESTLPAATVYRGKDLRQVLPALQSASIVHLASHGLFRQDNPAFSMLLLGSDVLTPADVPHLNLSAEMITISACSMGRSSIGLEGFTRAFATLGVATLIAPLWDVDDDVTAMLMGAFYTSLRENPDIAVAMQKAMKQVRMRHQHPFYWAAFNVIGRTRLRDSWKLFRKTCTDRPVAQTD